MARDYEKHYVDHSDDDDDWGMSGYPRSHSRQRAFTSIHAWRYRMLALGALLTLTFFYWIHSRSPSPTFVQPYHDGPVDWSRFAYVQYVTDHHSMCNAYMVFESLHRLGSQAERVLLYPEDWNTTSNDPDDRNIELLVRANDHYGVRLYPTQLLGVDGPTTPGTFRNPSTWESSVTKLRAFELEEYDRVLYFDNDILLQQHLDELFLIPSAPIAMPRRYWSGLPHWDWPLSGILMLIEPNAAETKGLWDRLQEWRLVPERAEDRTLDDDLLDNRFSSSALVLPHRPYVLQTSEFRRRTHEEYMGTYNGPATLTKWDARAEAERAKIIHFNDWPLPKPWMMWPIDGVVEVQPDCGGSRTGTCAERDVWKEIYATFRQRRKEVCKILPVPAPPDWNEYKRQVGYGS